MIETITPRINILEQSDTYGKFIVEPLEKGYGTTLGNALRRIMLSSIPGAAITAIKVDGVLHEFSTIPGVKEDATELILNLKELAIRVHLNGGAPLEPKTLRIDVKGPGDVTGADIQAPEDVEIANPEAYIASLNENARLSMELTVEVGKGYVLPEKHEKKHTIGIIPVGSAFTPVTKVNYVVEPTRVGHKTDYERLILEVSTNGTIVPSDAISDASKIMDGYLRLFFDFANGGSGSIGFLEALPGAGSEVKAPDARIEELDFSVRTYNCLKKANILTIRDLVQTTEAELMGIRNFGRKSLTEVKDKLAQFGLGLRKPAAGEVVYTALPDEDDEGDIDLDEEGE